MAITLRVSSTVRSKRWERTDGDEVSGKLFHYSPSPNLQLCGRRDYEVIMTKTYEVILLKIHSL